MPYTPHTKDEIKQMLEAIGASRIEDLWSAIPEGVRLGRPLDLPSGLAESELVDEVGRLAAMNRSAKDLKCLLGGGTYHHYVPPAVLEVISRSEFYTAYTPYQPEVSQGTLQAIFEFQTMVSELFGMEVANASMYDGASATAEAALMAERIRPKNKTGAILVARSVNPLYRSAIKTYCGRLDREIVEIGFDRESGALDLDELGKKADGALAAIVQSPNYFGAVEDLELVGGLCKERDVVFISAVTESLSMGLLEPPGVFGADIVAGEGQSLGVPMGFGGPHLGLFACREKNARKAPGRLVGETVDADGRRGYALTLATREQHIRRAKATSNICTNQGLMALSAAVYMSLIGPEGIREIAATNRARCEYLKDALAGRGVGETVFTAPTFNEFVIDVGREPGPVIEAMLEAGFMAGIPLGGDYPELKDSMLVTVTETLNQDDLDAYAEALAAAASG